MSDHTAEFTATVYGDPDDYIAIPMSLIEELDYQFDRFNGARSETGRASALVEVSNLMSDLVSWHPQFDLDQGEIVYEEDEA